jgi:hypothetical protein
MINQHAKRRKVTTAVTDAAATTTTRRRRHSPRNPLLAERERHLRNIEETRDYLDNLEDEIDFRIEQLKRVVNECHPDYATLIWCPYTYDRNVINYHIAEIDAFIPQAEEYVHEIEMLYAKHGCIQLLNPTSISLLYARLKESTCTGTKRTAHAVAIAMATLVKYGDAARSFAEAIAIEVECIENDLTDDEPTGSTYAQLDKILKAGFSYK